MDRDQLGRIAAVDTGSVESGRSAASAGQSGSSATADAGGSVATLALGAGSASATPDRGASPHGLTAARRRPWLRGTSRRITQAIAARHPRRAPSRAVVPAAPSSPRPVALDRSDDPGAGQTAGFGLGFLGFGCFLGFLSPTFRSPAGSDCAILRDAHGMGEVSCWPGVPSGWSHTLTVSPWPACGSACGRRTVRSIRHSSSGVAVTSVEHVAACGTARSGRRQRRDQHLARSAAREAGPGCIVTGHRGERLSRRRARGAGPGRQGRHRWVVAQAGDERIQLGLERSQVGAAHLGLDRVVVVDEARPCDAPGDGPIDARRGRVRHRSSRRSRAGRRRSGPWPRRAGG